MKQFGISGKSGLGRKIIQLLFMFGIIPMAVITAVFFFFYLEGQHKSIVAIQTEVSARVTSGISSCLEKTINETHLFAQILQPFMEDPVKMRDKAYMLLDQGLGFDAIAVSRVSGQQIVKVSKHYPFRQIETDNSVAVETFQKAVKGDVLIGPVTMTDFSGPPNVSISVPILDPADKIAAVLSVSVKMDRIWGMISNHQVGKSRYAYIIDQSGRLLSHEEVSSVVNKQDLTGIMGVQKFMEGKSGIYQYTGLKGRKVIGAVARISPSEWGLLVEEPVSSAYHHLYILSAFFLAISIATIVFAIIFGYRFSLYNIVKPIRRLQKEAESISSQDFTGRILVKRDDEVGQLARSFNQMLEYLDRTVVSRDTLAEEIRENEKTAQTLRKSVEENRAILTAIPDLILQIDSEGIICSYKTDANSSMCRTEIAIGKKVSDLFPFPIAEDVVNHGRETLRTGRIGVFEYPYRFQGEEKYIETRMAVSGENEVLAIFRDITDRKRSEKLLRENEERIKQVINVVPDMIYARDRNGVYILVNQAYAEFVGTDIHKLIGKKPSDFYSKSIAELAEKNDQEVLKKGDTRIFPDISVPAAGGETRILHITKKLLTVTKNGVALDVILSVANDITEIKRAEETLRKAHYGLEKKVRERTADLERINTRLQTEMEKRELIQKTLKEKEERFETQYQSMPIPTYTWQKSGEEFFLVGYNKAAMEITENGVREWKDKSIAEIYDGEPAIIEDVSKCYYERKTVSRQIEYQFKKSADMRQLDVIFAFVPPDLVMMHTADTTQTKILQDQLIRSERLAATGQLAASIAHEINSPLQGITALLSVIRKSGISADDLVQNIDLVKNAVGSIRDTVRNLLDLNRPGKEKKRPSDINEVISNTIALVSGYIRKNGISVHLNLDPSIPNLYISPQQFGQVFMNLINNSIEAITGVSGKTSDFSGTEKKKGKIDIATIQNNNNIIIEVGDNGPGISREDLEHVFDPFYTRKKKMGMGVGLSICHGIVTDHNGRIMVSSKKEGGVMFSIVVPIKTEPTKAGMNDA